jgi:hypothetical protein
MDSPLAMSTSIVVELDLVTEDICKGHETQEMPEDGSLISDGKVSLSIPLPVAAL